MLSWRSFATGSRHRLLLATGCALIAFSTACTDTDEVSRTELIGDPTDPDPPVGPVFLLDGESIFAGDAVTIEIEGECEMPGASIRSDDASFRYERLNLKDSKVRLAVPQYAPSGSYRLTFACVWDGDVRSGLVEIGIEIESLADASLPVAACRSAWSDNGGSACIDGRTGNPIQE